MYIVKRNPHNPILSPDAATPWRDIATCNPSPINVNGQIHLLFRAISNPNLLEAPDLTRSVIGICPQDDPEKARVLIEPTEDWEEYGCEDPRVTYIDGKYYIFYTALGGYPLGPDNIKVALAISSDLQTIDEKHLITPFNAKAMSLFPEKINGQYWVTFNAHTDEPPARFSFAAADRIQDFFQPDFWSSWLDKIDDYSIELRRQDDEHVEVGAPPLQTDQGWLMIYSHIQQYFSDQKIFGIEAILLDIDNPLEIIGQSRSAMAIAEESYERYGYVPQVIFPTGSIIENDNLTIYYGGADTTSNSMRVNLNDLLDSIKKPEFEGLFTREESNPILQPIKDHPWESQAVFNPSTLDIDGVIHMVYRAMSEDNTSVLGYATSTDGTTIDYRHPEPIYVPRQDFESKKSGENGFSGCEDPRLTIIDDRIYLCYTAYNGIEPPRVAMSSIAITDFTANNWDKWSKPVLISPAGVDDKDACIHPAKHDDKFIVIHRISHHICADLVNNLEFKDDFVDSCIDIMGPRFGMWDGEKIGIAGGPLSTSAGWLQLYHGVAKIPGSDEFIYSLGAALFDRDNPLEILSRTSEAIMIPQTDYEINGIVNNVVFPCGAVIRGDDLYVYYGAADKVIAVAKTSLDKLLQILTRKHYE